MKKAKLSTIHQPLHLLWIYLGFGEFPWIWTIFLPLKEMDLFLTCWNLPCQALAGQVELLGCNSHLFPFPVLPKSPKFCRKWGEFRAHTLPLPAPVKPWIPIILASAFPSKQILFHCKPNSSRAPKPGITPNQANKRFSGGKLRFFQGKGQLLLLV